MRGRKLQIPGQWSVKQLRLQQMLADPFDKRVLAEKAKEVGISERVLYKWKNMPGWQDTVFEIAKKWIGDGAPKVLRALYHKAKDTGDPVCVKLYLEIIGKYTQKTEMDIRAGRLEELSDEELRDIIAKGAAFQSGGSGGAPKTLPG
ncbi:MAG: phBC6A51 family helix-turn-helix protein [Omnitrophica bacterium]|nr:phBC6A51 family helix-turn-helix protein [Candidatus Omnitrophota bacterium]